MEVVSVEIIVVSAFRRTKELDMPANKTLLIVALFSWVFFQWSDR